MSELDALLRFSRPDGFELDAGLRIKQGTTAALLGPNGAGKSTTVDLLAGLIGLDDGHISLGGNVLDEPATARFVPPEQRKIGVVFQRYLLFDHLDVVDNVGFGPACRASGPRWRSRREARAEAIPWIEAMGLTGLEDRRPSQLSGGQAQRVAVARALASRPDLLLLDEPLASLDIDVKSRLRRTLATHLDSFAGPRLLITHDPTDAFLLADMIHIIEGGRITQVGRPDDIRRRPATPYVAALAGTNLVRGSNDRGALSLTDYELTLQAADTHTMGPVLITIHPRAIALHLEQPHGSPRNSWRTTVTAVEPLGETTRITVDDPLPLMIDITPAATDALSLRVGVPVWATVKATEISLAPT